MIQNKKRIIELSVILILFIILAKVLNCLYLISLEEYQVQQMKTEINLVIDTNIDINKLYDNYNIIKLVYENDELVEYPDNYYVKDIFDFDNKEYKVIKDYKGYFIFCSFDNTIYVKRINSSVFNTSTFDSILFLMLLVMYCFVLFLYYRNKKIELNTYKQIFSSLESSNDFPTNKDVELLCGDIKGNNDFKNLSIITNEIILEGILFLNKNYEVIYYNDNAMQFIVKKNGITVLIDDISFDSLNLKENQHIQIKDKHFSYNINNINNKEFYIIVINDITSEIVQKNNHVSFFNQASHELRTPLTTIQGLVELLSICELDPIDKEKTLDISLQECRRLELLITSIIDISKRNQMDDLVSKVNISNIVNKAIKECTSFKKFNVTTTIPGNIYLLCNGIKVDLIINQLIKNSTIHNTVDVYLNVELINNNGYIELIIKNTSKHLLEGEVERITEPLFRCRSTIDLCLPTTGMGLALVKGLCDAYKYQLSFSYENGIFTSIIQFYDDTYM